MKKNTVYYFCNRKQKTLTIKQCFQDCFEQGYCGLVDFKVCVNLNLEKMGEIKNGTD